MMNEQCGKHRCFHISKPRCVLSNDLSPSTTASESVQLSVDPYELTINDEDYLMPNDMADMTPRRNHSAAQVLPTARLFMNSPPALPKGLGQVNLGLIDYCSDPVVISNTWWILDITDRWYQPEKTHWKYVDLYNVACNTFIIIPNGVRVVASMSHGWDGIAWREPRTTGKTVGGIVIVRQIAWAINGILGGDDPGLDMSNAEYNLEMIREVEQKQLSRMAKMYDILNMWQGG